MWEPSGVSIRACWQKFAILQPKKIRTYFARQDQAGPYMYVAYSKIMINILA